MGSTTNRTTLPSESKREEFRKYLEKTGVMDALTKVLVSLYEERDKPENAIEYICDKLSTQLCGMSLSEMRESLEAANKKLTEAEGQGEAQPAPEGEEANQEPTEQPQAEAPAP